MIPKTPYENEYKEARMLHANTRITIYAHLIRKLNDSELNFTPNWTQIMRILKRLEKGGQDSSLADLIESKDATSIALHTAHGRFFAHENTQPLINRLFAFPISRRLENWIQDVLKQSNDDIDAVPTETFLGAFKAAKEVKDWLFGNEISTILASHTLYGSFLRQVKSQYKLRRPDLPALQEHIALAGLALFLATYMYRVLPIAHIHYTEVKVRKAYQANTLTLASFPIHPFARAATETLAAGGALEASKLRGDLNEDEFSDLADEVTRLMLGSTIQEVLADTDSNSPQGYFFWTALGEGMRAHLIAGAFLYAMFDEKEGESTVNLARAQGIQSTLLNGYELPTIQLDLLRKVSDKIDGRGDGSVNSDYMSQSRAVFSANFYWLRSLYQVPKLAALEEAPEAWSPDSLNGFFVEKAIGKFNRTKS